MCTLNEKCELIYSIIHFFFFLPIYGILRSLLQHQSSKYSFIHTSSNSNFCFHRVTSVGCMILIFVGINLISFPGPLLLLYQMLTCIIFLDNWFLLVVVVDPRRQKLYISSISSLLVLRLFFVLVISLVYLNLDLIVFTVLLYFYYFTYHCSVINLVLLLIFLPPILKSYSFSFNPVSLNMNSTFVWVFVGEPSSQYCLLGTEWTSLCSFLGKSFGSMDGPWLTITIEPKISIANFMIFVWDVLEFPFSKHICLEWVTQLKAFL